jgi:hypothetical protein
LMRDEEEERECERNEELGECQFETFNKNWGILTKKRFDFEWTSRKTREK